MRSLDGLGLARCRVLVAVSGGRDSCVLLELLRRSAQARGLELVVAHVHHGLRGEEADRDAVLVEDLARAAGLPFHLLRVDPEATRRTGPSRTRPSLEESARDLRRAALRRLADETGSSVVATAHHAGDQAETVLLRILRGTGPDGLAGITPRSEDGRFVRPLLTVSPERVEAFASANRLVWREDASNDDPRFRRNRVRHVLLPGLATQFNPRILRALVDLAEAARGDRCWIDGLVAAEAGRRLRVRDGVVELELDGWAELAEPLARRVVRRALVEAGLGRDVSRGAILRVLAVLRRGRVVGRDKKWELPGGFLLRRVGDHFELAASRPTS
ncbi:MAG: tRNA lysidine(34) synthetase TilS [Deltaproteobacteria bacterium]|nr:tRNA lysidine(34) synthetase TilS [Deltaproteobacteria bacterium]